MRQQSGVPTAFLSCMLLFGIGLIVVALATEQVTGLAYVGSGVLLAAAALAFDRLRRRRGVAGDAGR